MALRARQRSNSSPGRNTWTASEPFNSARTVSESLSLASIASEPFSLARIASEPFSLARIASDVFTPPVLSSTACADGSGGFRVGDERVLQTLQRPGGQHVIGVEVLNQRSTTALERAVAGDGGALVLGHARAKARRQGVEQRQIHLIAAWPKTPAF